MKRLLSVLLSAFPKIVCDFIVKLCIKIFNFIIRKVLYIFFFETDGHPSILLKMYRMFSIEEQGPDVQSIFSLTKL